MLHCICPKHYSQGAIGLAGEQQAPVCGNSTEEVRQATAAEDLFPAAPRRQFPESARDGNGHALLPRCLPISSLPLPPPTSMLAYLLGL